MNVARFPPVVLLAFSLGCQDADAPPGLAMRDSAGVRIVENSAPAWGPDPAWRVDSDPTLSLGAPDGAAELSFSRISGVYRSSDGTIAVVDAGSGQLRLFDADGRFMWAFGGPGQGPGEFEQMDGVGIRADSVWIYDGALSRLTAVEVPSGGYRSVSVDAQNLALGAVGVLPRGSFIFAADLTYTSAVTDSLPPGLHRFGAAYVRIASSGATIDTLMIVPGSERVLQYGEGSIQVLRPLFGRSVSHVLIGERLLFGDQEEYEIRGYALDGTLLDIVRRLDLDLSLTDEEYRAAIEERVRSAPASARPGLRAMYENQPKPATRAAFGRFLTDSSGHLWVQEFALDHAAPTWSVFTSDGRWLGTVDLPERFSPTQILGDEVLGVGRDELDVEYVRAYSLVRGAVATAAPGR